VENLAERGRVEIIEEASGLDAVLWKMGKPAQQVSSIFENGLANLPVHRRPDRNTNEAA